MVNGSRGCVVWFGHPAEHERDILIRAGWQIRRVGSAIGVDTGAHQGDGVVALADMRHCDAPALASMDRLMAEHSGIPWIVLRAPETPAWEPSAKRVLESGREILMAPVDMPRLLEALRRAGSAARQDVTGGDHLAEMVGRSPAMVATVASVYKFAPVELPVLITGETGTGKEVAAAALHRMSARRAGPFVPINCGALAPNLVQSELFGHERGAFTGANSRRIGHIESAAGGTVFLDEVGDLPLEAQTNLLRFLQEGSLERVGSSQPISIDVRVLAATHVDLEKAVAQGSFREDLYYRLNVLRLHMPPLRERGGDVELLAQHFLDHFREQHCSYARGFSSAARRAMRSYSWPGNVRELLNRVQRAAVVAEDALIGPADLDLRTNVGMIHRSLGLARVAAERDAIVACLRESQFNISECARRLSISRVTVYRLCKKHQLQLEDMR